MLQDKVGGKASSSEKYERTQEKNVPEFKENPKNQAWQVIIANRPTKWGRLRIPA
jgi:hypothetical protein